MEFHEHRAFQFFKEASYEELLQKIDHDPNLLSSTIIDRKYGYNFFMWACSHGSLDKATMFVRRGINLEQTDKEGNTALMLAIFSGQLQIVQWLIDLGAQVNHTNNLGSTPLISAAMNGDMELLKLLVNSGADIYHKNKNGESAIQAAFQWGHHDVVKCLYDHGADLDSIKVTMKWVLRKLIVNIDQIFDIYKHSLELEEYQKFVDPISFSYHFNSIAVVSGCSRNYIKPFSF